MNMETRAEQHGGVLVWSCCLMKLQDTREKSKKTDSPLPVILLPGKPAHSSPSPLLHVLGTVPVTAEIWEVKLDLPQRDALELQKK